MSWFWTAILLIFTVCSNLSEANHQKKLPSAVVVGTVYCHTCFHQDFPKANHFIAGASVEVQCSETKSRQGFRQEVMTNSHGEFKIQLPFSVSKHVRKIRGCSVSLLRSNEPLCAVAATAASSSLHLKSRKEGAQIFSAGLFSFKPLNQPQVCDKKPQDKNSDEKKLSPDPNSKKHTDQLPFLPNPLNPLPPIPLLPPPSILPPNPLLPPPSILPPNPLQPPPSVIPPLIPSPPPSIFPPLTPTPSKPPFFNLPPLPGLTPSPPPQSPTLPIPLPPILPPFPFQPTPGFPGVPPAEVSSESRTRSP